MTLMMASIVNNMAKLISDHTNQFLTLNLCFWKYSRWYVGVVTQASSTMATIAAYMNAEKPYQTGLIGSTPSMR